MPPAATAPGKDGRYLLTALGLLAACWGTLGWLDLPERGQAGFSTDGVHRVTQVRPGSPAEQAGLVAGDRILEFGGVATLDAGAIARMPPQRSGDQQKLTIERNGERRQLLVAYGPPDDRERAIERASLWVGCGFIFFPLLAFLRKPDAATRVLALMGTGLGLAMMDGPLIEDFGARAVSATIIMLFVLLGLACVLRFLVLFPPAAGRASWFTGTYSSRLIFVPAIALWLWLAWRFLFTPGATPALNAYTQVLAGLVMGAYLMASLYRFLRNYSRTDRPQRKSLGLNGMLWGTIAGVLPGLIARLVESFSPQAHLPGQDFYFVSLVLIPLTWARSAARPDHPLRPSRNPLL